MSKLSHIERTATDPRRSEFHSVEVDSVEQANASVRLVKLRKTYPGQSVEARPVYK